jgi:hypothetical protein
MSLAIAGKRTSEGHLNRIGSIFELRAFIVAMIAVTDLKLSLRGLEGRGVFVMDSGRDR